MFCPIPAGMPATGAAVACLFCVSSMLGGRITTGGATSSTF